MKAGKNCKIAVAGLGYVGLSLAVLLAKRHPVTAVDLDPERVDLVARGLSPLRDEDIESALRAGGLRLRATTDAESAYRDADFVVIAVPTSYDDRRGSFDMSAVDTVAEQIHRLNPRAALLIKSTVPVGYTAALRRRLGGANVLFSPEFLRETRALYDCLHPSRIILGGELSDPAQAEAARRFSELLLEGAEDENVPVLLMGSDEAEAVKLFSNAYLAMRVAFFNELDSYAETKGLDTGRIIRGVCLDGRIGGHYNNPSFGYGGYCLPKDTKQLQAAYRDIPEKLITAVVESNRSRKEFIAGQVLRRVRRPEGFGAVGVYRLTMKAGGDNFRQSSILDILDLLVKQGVPVLIYEPLLENVTSFRGCPVIRDLEEFFSRSELILANRAEPALDKVQSKVYTRDLFHLD